MDEGVRRPPPRLLAPVRRFFRGVGEVLAFFGASAAAIAELAVGRWPAIRQSRPKPKAEPPAERIAPYPIND